MCVLTSSSRCFEKWAFVRLCLICVVWMILYWVCFVLSFVVFLCLASKKGGRLVWVDFYFHTIWGFGYGYVYLFSVFWFLIMGSELIVEGFTVIVKIVPLCLCVCVDGYGSVTLVM